MKRILVLAVLAGLLACACAAHDYRRQGDVVTLILRKPDAGDVWLFTSLDHFKPQPAQNVSGRWEVSLPATRTFRYFYRVDGVPYIPDCTLKEKDDFGAENCIFDPAL